jgi:hypothetical protein
LARDALNGGTEVLVCNQWTLKLLGGEGGYYHYVNKRAGEVGRNAHCIRWLLEQLNMNVETVVEPFGGVGVFATVVQGVCSPKEHYLYDLDPDCLRQLRAAFADVPGVTVAKADATKTIGGQPADLYLLDFPSPFTALHIEDWELQLDRLFASNPGAVIWMDGASFGMHWHAHRYATALDYPVRNNRDYAKAISAYVHKHYGYAVEAATVSRGCFYFLLAPRPETIEFPVREFLTAGLELRPTRKRVELL